MKDLDRIIFDLLQDEPFYAHFILNSRIVFDKYGVDTAGAAVVNGGTVLIFNTKFMESLSLEAKTCVLKHEILHLLLGHHGRGKEFHKMLFNLSTDCALNQYIKDINVHLPQAISVSSLEKLCGETLEAFQTSEYYYAKLLQKAEQVKASRLSTLDDHDLDVPGQESNESIRKAVIANVSEKSKEMSKGNISQDLAKLVGSLVGQSQLNWKQILRNFVSKSISINTTPTRKKPHRRFDLDFPGKKKKKELTLGVCIDVSGSISDEMFASFMQEVLSLVKNTNMAYLIHADCEIKHIEILKPNSKIDMIRHGNGGTAYNPALVECRARKCDAILYFGDFDCADVPEDPGIPVLWVGTNPNVKPPGNFGSVIYLDAV